MSFRQFVYIDKKCVFLLQNSQIGVKLVKKDEMRYVNGQKREQGS